MSAAVSRGFGSYEQFQREILTMRSGPLASAVDDIAEELYHTDIQEEADGMWDAKDND